MASRKVKKELIAHNNSERNYDRSVSNALKGAWTKWLGVLTENNLETHEECARFLIYWYEKYVGKVDNSSIQCSQFAESPRRSNITHCHVNNCKGHSHVREPRQESVGTVTRSPDGGVTISFRVMSTEPECISVLVNGHHMLGSPFQHAQFLDYADTNADALSLEGVKNEVAEQWTVSHSCNQAPHAAMEDYNLGPESHIKEEIAEEISHNDTKPDPAVLTAGSYSLHNQMETSADHVGDQTIATIDVSMTSISPKRETIPELHSPSTTKSDMEGATQLMSSNEGVAKANTHAEAATEEDTKEVVDNVVMNEYLQWRYAEDQTSIADDSPTVPPKCDAHKSPKRKRGRARKGADPSDKMMNSEAHGPTSIKRQSKRKRVAKKKATKFAANNIQSSRGPGKPNSKISTEQRKPPLFHCTSSFHCKLRFHSALNYDFHKQAHSILERLDRQEEGHVDGQTSDKCERSNKDTDQQTSKTSRTFYDNWMAKYRTTNKIVCPFPSCSKVRPNPNLFDQHLVRFHGNTKSNFICPVAGCGKEFVLTCHVRYHMKYCHSEKSVRKILCDICGKSFKSSKCLWVHKTTHADKNERIYKCPVPGCKSDFALEKYLKQHEKTHRTEYNYLCHTCGKSFKRDECLQAHYRSLAHKNKAGLTVS